jgi:hypothetical protein
VAKFTDITREAGITFVHNNGAYGDKLLPETMGGGVAFFDYDNDGHQDLLFINSTYWPGHIPEGKRRRRWRSITTTGTAISPMSPKAPASTSVATAWAWPSGITTMTGCPMFSSPPSAGIICSTTTATASFTR